MSTSHKDVDDNVYEDYNGNDNTNSFLLVPAHQDNAFDNIDWVGDDGDDDDDSDDGDDGDDGDDDDEDNVQLAADGISGRYLQAGETR